MTDSNAKAREGSEPSLIEPLSSLKAQCCGRPFFENSVEGAKARKIFLNINLRGLGLVTLTIFAVFPIFWGSVWKGPSHVHNLKGLVVDFDEGQIGHAVTSAINSINMAHADSMVSWHIGSSSDYLGPFDLANSVLNEDYWVAISVNPGSSSALNASVHSPNVTYDGSGAITAFMTEARQENGYRVVLKPIVDGTLRTISQKFAIEFSKSLANDNTVDFHNLLANSPQTVTLPISYNINNLRPFDTPVASVATFVGMIFQLILSFIVTMVNDGARRESGLDKRLKFGSLIGLRMISPVIHFFFISLFYSLLNLAFGLPLNRTFGHSGFLVFWMVSWIGMISLGFALEAMLTILTTKFIPFFLLLMIIANISVCVTPIELQPAIFRYGHAAPFYNISRVVRTVVFGTRNQVGLNFGVLIAWIAVSCLTLPLLQWLILRKERNLRASTIEKPIEI